jgi:hypothetical protein
MKSALPLAFSALPSKPAPFLVEPQPPARFGASGNGSVSPSVPTNSSVVAPIAVPSRAAAASSVWGIWKRFCISFGAGGADEFLSCGTDPLNVLPFFGQPIATGALLNLEQCGPGLRHARVPRPTAKYVGFYRLSRMQRRRHDLPRLLFPSFSCVAPASTP